MSAEERIESILFTMALLLWQVDASTFGEEGDSLHEADPIYLLDEFEHIAPYSTAKAVVDLPLCIDVEGRSLLVVEWAKTGPVVASLTQFHMCPDDVDDVRGVTDSLEGFFRNAGHE